MSLPEVRDLCTASLSFRLFPLSIFRGNTPCNSTFFSAVHNLAIKLAHKVLLVFREEIPGRGVDVSVKMGNKNAHHGVGHEEAIMVHGTGCGWLANIILPV